MSLQPTDYPARFSSYISLVDPINLSHALPASYSILIKALTKIPENKANFAYAPQKWTVKQVLQHCIDTERIFAYRALCIARDERQPLPSFDENQYADNALVDNKSLQFLKDELSLLRQSTILMFEHFSTSELNRSGIVSNQPITVLTIGNIIIGHWLHHMHILHTKYGI